MKIKTNKVNNKFQLLICDFLIVIGLTLVYIISIKESFLSNTKFDMNLHMSAVFGPLAIIVLGMLGFGIYVEHKYNKLSLKNIFLLFGIIVTFNNILMMCILPSNVILTNYGKGDVTLSVSVAERLYSIIYSACISFSPFLVISVFSRNILHKKYLKYFLYFIIFFPTFFTLLSFFTDFNNYIYTIKTGFSDSSHPVVSILRFKFGMSGFLFIGIVACTFMHIIYKNWKWLLLGGLFLIVIFFTFSKLPILLAFLYCFIYAIAKIIFLIKKDRNNIFITIFVLGFIVVLGTILCVLMAYSQTGLLFKIKTAILNGLSSAKTTMRWRFIIWESTFKMLKPYQYIFGFGFYLSGKAIHLSYANNPALEENPQFIYHAHNASIQCIADGGIIYLLIQIFIFVMLFYYSIKVYKSNKLLSIMNIVLLSTLILNGVVDPVILFSDSLYIFITLISVVPIMATYYSTIDKKEIERRKEIIQEAKEIKNINFEKKVFKWNKAYLINSAKNISLDIKNYIKN